MGFLKSLLHTGASVASKLPVVGELADPLLDCTSPQEEVDKRHSKAWLHHLAVPLAMAAGAMSGVWSLISFGPTPLGLLSGPIFGAMIYALIDGAACAGEGRSVFSCVTGGAMGITNKLMGSLTGGIVDPDFMKKTAGSLERAALSKLGCKNANLDDAL